MASKRRIRRKQCGQKQRFKTIKEASKVIERMRRTGHVTGQTSIYKCQWCGKYHWGHGGRR